MTFTFILMRKDPPFNKAYLYATYLLEIAQQAGCPDFEFIQLGVRNANEKLFEFTISAFVLKHLSRPIHTYS